MAEETQIAWTIHRDSDGGCDTRCCLHVDRSSLGASFDQFVQALHQWEKDRQHHVIQVRDWHANVLIISLDIGDRNSSIPAEPTHIWDQRHYEQEHRRLTKAVMESLNHIHALLVQVNPNIDPRPKVINCMWMNQPSSLPKEVVSVASY